MLKTFTPSAYERVDDRGRFVEILAEGKWEAVVHGEMDTGAVLGRQYHRLTQLYLYLTSGSADVDLVNVATGERATWTIRRGKGIFVAPGTAYAVRFNSPSTFVLCKSRRYDPAELDRYDYDFEALRPAEETALAAPVGLLT